MKRLSMWLTVLWLGGLPLAAAALDYGPNRPLLAAENGAPPLPGMQPQTAAPGAMAQPDAGEADIGDTTGPASVAPRAAASTASPAVARNPGPTARNRARNPAPSKTIDPIDPAAWRSLLPGSIQ
jgi:hypothetical protein